MKSVLVTGATGFIGRATVSALISRGYSVHGVSRRPPSTPSCTWHVADLLDPKAAPALVAAANASHLVHLAWTTEHPHYWTSTVNLEWVEASSRLFREFHSAGGRRIVAAGTCAEYAWNDPDVVSGAITECSPRRPQTLYGISKNSTFDLLRGFCRAVGLGFAWGRVFFPYGPGDERPTLIPTIIRNLLSGNPAPCTHGEQERDFIHVRDVGAAFAALLDADVEGAVNIATGTGYSVAQVANEIGGQLGRTDLIHLGALPSRPGDPSRIVADTTRLREKANYRPSVQLRDGLRETIEWWRARSGPSSHEQRN